jgi:hypothetical protein
MSTETAQTPKVGPLSDLDRFTGRNYSDWAQHMQVVLAMIGVWESMENAQTTPESL